jgi:phosphoserine phosphatase RsbU/P
MAPTPDTRRIPLAKSLRGKLIALLTLFVVLTALLLSINDYRYVRNMLRDGVQQQLLLTVEGLQDILNAYISQQHERARLVASRTRLRALLASYLDGELSEPEFRQQTELILADALASTSSFYSINIADTDGRLVTSTDLRVLNQSVTETPDFELGLQETSLGLPIQTADGYHAVLFSPMRTNEGRLLGVLIVDVDVEPMREILNAIPSSYSSYQVRVAAKRDGRIHYLFPIGIDEQVTSVSINDDPVMSLAVGPTGGFKEDDYAGREVLVAYKNVGYRNWGLVAQVDADEAYEAITDLRGVVAIAGVLVALLGIGIGVRVAARFTAPILELTDIATRVGSGDLTAKARQNSKDEVGLMAAAFNEMTSGLQRHQNQLEELVKARTNVLEHRTQQLERSNEQLAALCQLLEDQADTLERDLQRAEIIQQSLLPSSPPDLPGFRVQTLYRPGHNIGGDLYDIISMSDRYLVLVVADAAGHGVSAALLAVLFKHRLVVGDGGKPLNPATALQQLNRKLMEDITAPGVFFTCCYCLLDTVTNSMVAASAGHPPMILLRNTGQTEELKHTGPALGLYDDAAYEERTLTLRSNDRLLLYTDGVFDVGPSVEANVAVLSRILGAEVEGDGVLERVLHKISGGFEQDDRDDVTMVLLEASPGTSHYNDNTSDMEFEVAPQHSEPRITWAGSSPNYFICIAGRLTWTYGETMLAAASRLMDDGGSLTVDLSSCEYLDSTMLGTLHELVRHADTADCEVTFQGADRTLVEAFEELSMENVLRRIAAHRVDLPEAQHEVAMRETDLRRQQSRLLRAHEELAALSEANQKEFAGVIEELRAETDQG